ncbi:hypothetical protein GAGA_1483 [Paraglaciecola agarilytica NO2]|uniref:Uncharacterized protein n=1 Tax=Paraglaciecola agarilytica NO2 TaxID=1125747 RepID=A0ABQ0I4Q3_9ALTE|nr:hypothetical protein GAGA_1483 [Paraglaciecola agarilytica NO2]
MISSIFAPLYTPTRLLLGHFAIDPFIVTETRRISDTLGV